MNKDLYLDKITVLIPMFNASKTVEKCVRSVMRQTYTNLEIIVVDDGSKDNSYEIVKKLADVDSRIKLLQKENEKSVAKTRKFLLNQISTKYFVFVDSDDTIKKKYIEHLYNAMIKYNADCVASSFKINGKIPFSSLFTGTKIITGDSLVSTAVLSRNVHFVLWNKIYKTEIAKQFEFNDQISYGEDLIFCYEYLKRCQKAVFINKYDYKYILTKGSEIHKKFSNKNIAFLDWLEKAIENEDNNNNKRALKAWTAFTSASFKYLMKESKYQDNELKARLNENIQKYNDDFTKNKFTSKIFKLAYKFTKRIK